MNIIITGPKHCGKSTVISRVLERFSGTVSGFITEFDKRESSTRELFMRSIDGSQRCCAVKWTNGTLRVFPENFNNIGSQLINLNSDLIVIDELGKFEKNCTELRDAVITAFSSQTAVIAAVRLDAAGWMQELKSRNDVLVINVSDANRDVLPDHIIKLLISC